MGLLRAARAKMLACFVGMVGGAFVGPASTRDARADEPEKRVAPDYDGRGPEKRRGEGLLWVPRILVSPFYLTSEYVLRRPLGAVVKTAEENHWAQGLTNFFTFDKAHKIGLVPTFFYEFNFRPSVGAYFFWDDAFFRKNAFRVHVATGGAGWYSASITDRVLLGDGASTLAVRGGWSRRSDYVFYGLGPRTHEYARSRYSADLADVNFKYLANLWRASGLVAYVGARDMRFSENGSCCHDPSLAERAAAGDLPVAPAGFDEGYTAVYQHLEAFVDNRRPAPVPGSGVRFEVHGEHAVDLKSHPGSSWVKYGGTAGAFLDVTGKQRVLSVAFTVLFADPLRGDIPFTEQVVLGGVGPMGGYRPGRLIDRSAAIATLQYQWPIWAFLDGYTQLALGNVFGAHLDGLAMKLMRVTTNVGIRTSGSRDQSFEILFGVGSETLDEGLRFTSKRFLIGATRGF